MQILTGKARRFNPGGPAEREPNLRPDAPRCLTRVGDAESPRGVARDAISTQLSSMQIAGTAGRLFLPITEMQRELWMLENVDR